ncbi:hypothetical protein BKE38_28835 [Pseudoroseomonas deserti]|uniref:Uncharacterized protein n=2 Tax=Teichococcus deserti TaxID=1817963 RepID=A0A1V2GUV7_9PROT|nr:hypothetical protein BKE38_28835 [Pseudoroseomonas deserti]
MTEAGIAPRGLESFSLAEIPVPPSPLAFLGLLGWPCFVAGFLLIASPLALLLPGEAVGTSAAIGGSLAAAALALAGGALAMRRVVEEAGSALAVQDLPHAIRAVLQEERRQTHQASQALSRAVTTGAQLSSLARAVEKQLKESLAQAPALEPAIARLAGLVERAEAAQSGLPQRLETVLSRLESAIPAQALSRIEDCARQLSTAGAGLPALTEAAAQIGSETRRLQRAGVAIDWLEEITAQLATAPAAPAVGVATMPAPLEGALAGLAQSLTGLARNEASLGDAARYLTETTDRYAAITGQLETHAVRLQAMIRISGERDPRAEVAPLCAALEQQITAAEQLGQRLDQTQQQMVEALAIAAEVAASQAAPPPDPAAAGPRILGELEHVALTPAARGALQELGRVETHAGQLLQQAEALTREAWPIALSQRAPELQAALHRQAERLQRAARALTPRDF